MSDNPKQVQTNETSSAPAWANHLFADLGLKGESDATVVYERADTFASQLAPNTRRMYSWLLFIEAVAVLVPLMWLMALRLELQVAWIGYGVVVCTLSILGLCWWLRWNDMQQTWTRARLLAEIARSIMAVNGWHGNPTRVALDATPRIFAISDMISSSVADDETTTFEELKSKYLADRIDAQVDHYTDKNREARKKRKQISSTVTRCLDGALFLAVAGLIVGLSSSPERWLRLSLSDIFLGVVGAALPLMAIVYQSLGSQQELNRRTGRYRQQLDFLQVARRQMVASKSLDEASQIVTSVERALLGEVTEWFYQRANSETFYRLREIQEQNDGNRSLRPVSSSRTYQLLNVAGRSFGYASRVVAGRVLVVALSVVLTTIWIQYKFPEEKLHRNMLRVADGRLLASAKPTPWDPQPEKIANGLIIIAHGLQDSVAMTEGDVKHWITQMQEAISSRFDEKPPEICLVDWRVAARPARESMDGFFVETEDENLSMLEMLADLPKIRPHAQEVGDLVGYKLVRAIKESGKIPEKMHFIGHSAGGFVVVRAALVLQDFGMTPADMRVTLLDTPAPDTGDILQLLKSCKVDFYATSAFTTVGVPSTDLHENYTFVKVEVPEKIKTSIDQHNYAYDWYVSTVKSKKSNGFARSPFMVDATLK